MAARRSHNPKVVSLILTTHLLCGMPASCSSSFRRRCAICDPWGPQACSPWICGATQAGRSPQRLHCAGQAAFGRCCSAPAWPTWRERGCGGEGGGEVRGGEGGGGAGEKRRGMGRGKGGGTGEERVRPRSGGAGAQAILWASSCVFAVLVHQDAQEAQTFAFVFGQAAASIFENKTMLGPLSRLTAQAQHLRRF